MDNGDLVKYGVAFGASSFAYGFLTEIGKQAAKSLIEKFSEYSVEVKKKLEKNQEDFLTVLAKKISALEETLSVDDRRIFEEALKHPGSSLLFMRATVAASTTDVDERHEILAELIRRRVTSGADDMVALAGSAACDVVSALSVRQIHILAVGAKLFHITSSYVMPEGLHEEDQKKLLMALWSPMEELCEGLGDATAVDFFHLLALGCAVKNRWISRYPNELLGEQFKLDKKLVDETFNNMPWYHHLAHALEVGLSSIDLTSTGQLIGVMFHDSIVGKYTDINW